MEKAVDVGSIGDGAGLKCKGFSVRHPPGQPRLQFAVQHRMHIEESGAGTAAEPFHRPTHHKIDIESLEVDGHSPCRLVDVQYDFRAHRMSLVNDGLNILN